MINHIFIIIFLLMFHKIQPNNGTAMTTREGESNSLFLLSEPKSLLPTTFQNNNTRRSSLSAPVSLPMKDRTDKVSNRSSQT